MATLTFTETKDKILADLKWLAEKNRRPDCKNYLWNVGYNS